jgi:hypothetical protein
MTELPNFPNQIKQNEEERPFANEEISPAIPPFVSSNPSEDTKFIPSIPSLEEQPSEPQFQMELPVDQNIKQPEPTTQSFDNATPIQGGVAQPTIDPTQATMPSEVDSYKPLELQAQIAEITPGKFDNLTKVLDILRQNRSDAISIKQSYIYEGISGAIIVADVRQIFDNKKVDFQITDPKKHVDLFKSFKGNNNIFILDDPENTRFILTNGPIKIFLPKQVDQLVADTTSPDVSKAETICQKTINKDIRSEIRGLGKHSNSIEYLIQENKIKAMHIPDTGIYRFEEYIKDPGVAKLDETNSDLVLKSEMFLPVESDNYTIHICKLPSGEYLSITECNTGLVNMWIFEQLEDTTGGNLSF